MWQVLVSGENKAVESPKKSREPEKAVHETHSQQPLTTSQKSAAGSQKRKSSSQSQSQKRRSQRMGEKKKFQRQSTPQSAKTVETEPVVKEKVPSPTQSVLTEMGSSVDVVSTVSTLVVVIDDEPEVKPDAVSVIILVLR